MIAAVMREKETSADMAILGPSPSGPPMSRLPSYTSPNSPAPSRLPSSHEPSCRPVSSRGKSDMRENSGKIGGPTTIFLPFPPLHDSSLQVL